MVHVIDQKESHFMSIPLRTQLRNEMLEHHDDSLSFTSRIWRTIALFAFRHWGNGYRGHPIGIPGHRDPLMPCLAYNPRPPDPLLIPRCVEPDYHYLCERCAEHPQHHRSTPEHIQLSINRDS